MKVTFSIGLISFPLVWRRPFVKPKGHHPSSLRCSSCLRMSSTVCMFAMCSQECIGSGTPPRLRYIYTAASCGHQGMNFSSIRYSSTLFQNCTLSYTHILLQDSLRREKSAGTNRGLVCGKGLLLHQSVWVDRSPTLPSKVCSEKIVVERNIVSSDSWRYWQRSEG